jgi:hypothetical protein
MCPDFWKLEKVDIDTKKVLIENNTMYGGSDNTFIIPEIMRESDKNIQYKCVYDKDVYGDTRKFLETKKGIVADTNIIAGFNNVENATTYASNPTTSVLSPDYIVKLPKNMEESNDKGLKSYAKFSGGYTKDNATILNDSNNKISLRPAKSEYLTGTADDARYSSYEANTPLICNQVFPQVLGILDSKTKDENEISCEYAKQCGISWSSLNCKSN